MPFSLREAVGETLAKVGVAVTAAVQKQHTQTHTHVTIRIDINNKQCLSDGKYTKMVE